MAVISNQALAHVRRYAVAIAVSVLAVVVRHQLDPVLEHRAPFLVLALAVMLGAAYGGLGPGLVATALTTTLGSYHWITGHRGVLPSGLAETTTFLILLVTGLSLSFICETMRQARRRETALLASREASERTARAYNRTLIEAMLDPLIAISVEGKITDVNVATERITGRPRAELIGTDFSEYFTAPVTARQGYERVFRDSVVRDFPLEIRRKDGRVTPVLYNATVFRNESGHVEGVFAAARDVTEQRRAEEALLRANAYNRSLIEASLDPLVTIDAAGKITDANAATENATGRRREELIGADFSDFFTEPDKARAGYQQVFREGSVQDYALEIRRRDGPPIPVLYNASLYRDRSGTVVGVFAAARNIAERRRVEDELRRLNEELERRVQDRTRELAQSNAALQNEIEEHKRDEEALHRQQALIDAAFDNILAQVAYLDRDFELVRVNVPYADGCGRSPEQLVGRNHFDLFPDAENRAIFERVRDTQQPYVARAKPFVFPDDNDRGVTYWDWWLRPIPGRDGRTEGLVLSLVDVTAVERSFQEVERLNTELRRANAAKDQFLAALSHELRTPLTPALLVASALEADAGVAEPIRQDLATVRQSIEVQTRLIDDLLDLTRITSGKVMLRLEPVDAHADVRKALATCASDVREKQLGVRVELRAAASCIRADRARLQQVFWNIIKNAVKFTPPGGTVTIKSKNDADGSLIIEVTDTGFGIEPEVLPRIFDAFQQGETAVPRRFGGLGLGLTISKAVVESLGGRIAAESAGRNQGATLRVELPTVAETPAPEASHPTTSTVGASARILLVEDHESTLNALARLLTAFGHDVRTTTTVQGALELASSCPFDVVISDLGLPDGDGLDLMRRLKADHAVRGIALSGYGTPQDVETSRSAGFEAHLTKPIDIHQLQAALHGVTAG